MVVSVALALVGCGGQADRDYLGVWTRQNENRQDNGMGAETVSVVRDTLTIERNGDGYLLHLKRTNTQDGGKPFAYPEFTEPGVLKDGQLQVSGGLGAYVVDKKTGHMVSPDHQGDYVRADGASGG
jgi:hypothetical protein